MLQTVNALTPGESLESSQLIDFLIRATRLMDETSASVWHARLAEVYGDLAGQRAFDHDKEAKQYLANHVAAAPAAIVIALQTYFAFLCDVLAVTHLTGGSTNPTASLLSDDDKAMRTTLEGIASARVFHRLGIRPSSNPVPFDWYLPHVTSRELRLFKRVIAWTVPLAQAAIHLPAYVDVIQRLYAAIMPRNLLHVLGEFYTPPWLAQLLLEDLRWEPTKRLIDPYAGSGVFLVAALHLAKKQGADPLQTLQKLAAIDLNPAAYVATRANLLLRVVAPGDLKRPLIRLPILCADSLLPCILSPTVAAGTGAASQARFTVDGVETQLSTSREDRAALAHRVKAYLRDVRHGLAEMIQTSPVEIANCEGRAENAKVGNQVHPDRNRLFEHLAVLFLTPADVLVTNPPWVGWEYMSRPYRNRLNPAWRNYSLYTAKGRDAAFLKEDLSTLALVGAWDKYLKPGGTSAVVIRPASMQSHLAAKGLRRLSIQADSEPLCLRLVRDFDGLRPFANTGVRAAAWVLEKGSPTIFPVPVKEWRSSRKGWQPDAMLSLEEVRNSVQEVDLAASRSNARDPASPWTIGPAHCHAAAASLLGSNDYKVRTGVFTGGANAVYYVERLAKSAPNGSHWYRNIIDRAKRKVEQVEVELEDDLIYEVVRGRDLSLWNAQPSDLILCPHTSETKMRAIPKKQLQKICPKVWRYLLGTKDVLDARKGFSGWERPIQEEAFYAIQRIGEYTFRPYKTAWRYIAADFIVAVIGADELNRPRMCNDKVMYVSFDDELEAYFFCGLLSSAPVRWCVVSTMTGTQISTSAIKHLHLPRFVATDGVHRQIAEACKRGHVAVKRGQFDAAEEELSKINEAVASIYGLSRARLRVIRSELFRRYSPRRFSLPIRISVSDASQKRRCTADAPQKRR